MEYIPANKPRNRPYDFLFKLLLIGDSGVGKTEVLLRFSEDDFNSEFISTIGIDFKIKTIELDGKKIKLQIWVAAGQERFLKITTAYYRDAKGIMLMYDITWSSTYENIFNKWISEVQKHASSDVVKMLIGTKCHKEDRREVSRGLAAKLAEEYGMKFMEVSAKENINIEEAFYTLARDVLKVQSELSASLPVNASLPVKEESSLQASSQKQPKGFFSSVRKFIGKLGRKSEQTNSQPPSSLPPTPPPSPSSPRWSSSSPSPSSSSNQVKEEPKQSKAPPEILARGILALRAFNNALSEGRTCVKRVPVMLIGQDRSGKTSLKKSLKGQLFNPDEDSTVGIDVDPSHFKVSTEIWKAGEKDQETTSSAAVSYEHHAAQLIAGSLLEEKQTLEERASVSIQSESVSLVTVGSSTPSHSFASSESQAEPKERTLEPVQPKSILLDFGDSPESSHGFPLKFPKTPNASDRDSKPLDEPRDHVSNPSELDQEDASKVPEEIATLVERLLHEVKNVEDEKDIYSVLWDFGGQSVYYVTHPLFLTSRAIYLLIYDLNRNPHGKANPLVKQGMFKTTEDNFSLKTNLDYLDFWMTSVASLASQDENQQASFKSSVLPESLPPVFLVCTHADEPYGGVKPCVLANEIFDFLQNKPYNTHLFENVFVVDNTKSGRELECTEVIRLRQEVHAVAKELPQMKEAIPIKWLQYEKAIQVTKEEGHQWISLEEAKQIASEVCKIDDDQEILTLLNFLHDQRILIHFDDTSELNRLVVLEPQWLIDVFKKVITVKRYDHEEKEFKELWRKLEKTGILEEALLEHVWGPLLDQAETYESLIAIMEKFSLMCLWPSLDASCRKQYLVPSMLMSHPPQGITTLLESAQIPSLFLKFESYQIPPSLFPRLVLQFFQWCTEEFPSPLDPQLYHNFARFYISSDVGCSVVLLCHPSSLEVVVFSENHNIDLDEELQSKASFSTDRSQCIFEVTVARAVRRQLVLLLECMKKEFCWLSNVRSEVSFLCPVCSQGGTVNYCQTHRAQGCKQQECLHFWSESELCNGAQAVICRESADTVETMVQGKQFAPWFIIPNEKEITDVVDGRLMPIVEVHEETREEKTLALPSAVQEALLSQSCHPKDVVVRLQEDLQLEQASLENPEPEAKRMIRCLARKAKCSNRLDVVKHLREVTPAGTTGPLLHDNLDVQNIPLQQSRDLSVYLCGGDEWMTVAERLGLTPAEIRFLERRCNNPFEAALGHSRNQQYLNVGQLYDVLVECGFQRFADLL